MGYTEILEAINKLSDEQFFQLKSEIDKIYSERKEANRKKEERLKLLLNGPVMTDEQYEEYLEGRKHFNEWRKESIYEKKSWD